MAHSTFELFEREFLERWRTLAIKHAETDAQALITNREREEWHVQASQAAELKGAKPPPPSVSTDRYWGSSAEQPRASCQSRRLRLLHRHGHQRR